MKNHWGGNGAWGLFLGQCFIEVENQVGESGPGGEFIGRDVGRVGGEADLEEGGGLIGMVVEA